MSVWKRLACRPTGTAGAGPSPPTSKRCQAPSLAIGQSLAPWTIRIRPGTQPEEKAACSLHVEAPGGPTYGQPAVASGAGPSPPTCTRCKVPSFGIVRAFLPWIIRTRSGPQPEEKAACSFHGEAPGGPTHG
jgi:hypothetical protein